MKIILVDPNAALCDAFKEYFAELPYIEVVKGYFENLPAYDCMVSPANSFGIMDGGVDAAITAYFGRQLMERVQQKIVEKFMGEQPVGTSMIVETGHPETRF